MDKIRNALNMVMERLSQGILGTMVILVTWQVVARYIFSSPVPWTETLTKYLFVWIVLLNGAYIFGKREHMNIGFLRGKMKPSVQKGMGIACEMITGIFALVVLFTGGILAVKVGLPQKDAALEISMGLVYLALPVSGALITFYSVCNIRDILKGKISAI